MHNTSVITSETINLSDFVLFLSVMKNKTAYRNTLSIILDEPDVQIREVKVEQVVLNKSGKRAIRLDAWALSEDERQFNMEMENHSEKDSKELVSLLQYMKDTDIENPEILIKDKRILELDKIVAEVKESEEWEDTQMTIYDMGIAKGRIDSIFEILEEFGNLSENLRNEILAQTDMDILKKWFKLAAKVSSIDEFTQKMHE